MALAVRSAWYVQLAFIVTLTIGATIDRRRRSQSGAFTFYFARSMRPIDYVIGKLAGLALLIGDS